MQFAARTQQIRSSHIREILKVAANPAMISFAGGLPNPEVFPVAELAEASAAVFKVEGRAALQYANSEGLLELREWISARYLSRHGITIPADEILITSGSQQALDLLGKVLIDPGQSVIVEEPAYLGALQAFAMYEPRLLHVPLEADGVNIDALERTVAGISAADRQPVFYSTPDSQNPAGVTCSAEKRRRIAALSDRLTIIEDNPYGELVYDLTTPQPPLLRALDDRVILLGSFSKIIAPGMRLGWVCAHRPLYDRLVIARQAADLHTSALSQLILARYLATNDLDAHIAQLRATYRANRDAMLAAIEQYFPAGAVELIRPGGGMFLWCRLTNGVSAEALFHIAMQSNVLFVPGTAFYPEANRAGDQYMRLNFSNASPDSIRAGIERLGHAIADCVRSARGMPATSTAANSVSTEIL